MVDKNKEAENFEDLARNAKKEKNYDLAIEYFRKAIHIYEDLNYTGQIGMIEKEIKRIESLVKFLGPGEKAGAADGTNAPEKPAMDMRKELDKMAGDIERKIKTLVFQKDYDQVISAYQELAKIYEELGFEYQIRKVNFEIDRYKNLKNMDSQDNQSAVLQRKEQELSIAQERALRLERERKIKEEEEKRILTRIEDEERERQAVKVARELSVREKADKAKQDRLLVFEAKKSGVDIDAILREKDERERRLKELENQKLEQERKIREANTFMDEAKRKADSKEFPQAAALYQKAANAFALIGWTQQADMLLKEVKNMALVQHEYETKLKEEQERRRREQEEFEARATKILAEKEAKRKAEEEARNKLPPEIQEKVNQAEFVLQKAKELEEKEKFEKALSRYEYLLELYQQIPNFGPEKSTPIKSKIEELKKKVPPSE